MEPSAFTENPVFTVRNLQFSYRQNRAVDIPFLELETGKIHVFLGPNGSGKTTFLKLLNRLLYPDSGEIIFNDKKWDKSTANEKKTVYVHQSPFLLTGTVYDNIAYGLKIRGDSRRDIPFRVREVLDVVGLTELERRKNHALSGGEIQRVAIARALALNPEVLLLDEPTASVDKKNVGRLEELLLYIRDRLGCTILVSTHDLPFAYRICDRMIHMEEGSIQPAGENILSGEVTGTDPHFLVFTSGRVDSII